jgi:hypothetical protein
MCRTLTLGAFPELQKETAGFIKSVHRPICHPPMWNSSFPIGQISIKFNVGWGDGLTKICKKKSSLVKIGLGEEVLYMRICIHLWLLGYWH